LAVSTQKNAMTGQQKAERIAAISSEGKAEDIVILDLRELSNITDYFVIFSGTSSVHLRALGDKIEKTLRDEGLKPGQVDGQRGSGWMVFDYGNVIIHAMMKESRQLFELERLWGDAPRIDWE
jgi:ribosome-associated protein